MPSEDPILKHSNNPFPGLRAFEGGESHLFFGREEHVSDIVSKLNHNHFVAIVGSSGTGKSSLIKAGVLPNLASIVNDENENEWQVASMKPGSSPFLNLVKSICENTTLTKGEQTEVFKKDLMVLMTNSSLGLVQGMRSSIKGNTKLLILVDQFEEVFRFSGEKERLEKEQYNAFVKLIIDTVKQKDVPIYAILTLRSDFLGDCVQFEGLPEAINDGHYLVPRMTEVQMKRAISGPIDFAKGKISPRLIRHISHDLGNRPDQLPVLQHALMRCWNYWELNAVSGEPMDLHHFEAIGDFENAISSHANEAFKELDKDQKEIAEKVFKCLTTKKAKDRGVRRPMSMANLVRVTGSSSEEIRGSIMHFQKAGCSFLLPSLEVDAKENTIYDISHESLMRGWDRLANWVEEEMQSAEFYMRICTAASLYKNLESALWRNPELQLALDWKESQKPKAEWAELYQDSYEEALDFIEKSKEAYLLEGKKKKNKTSLIRASVIAFITVILVLAGWALNQSDLAQEKTKEAELQSAEALGQKSLAEASERKATEASNEAIEAKTLAEEQAEVARDQAENAKNQKIIADNEKRKAENSAQLAKSEKKIADFQRQEAFVQKQKADEAAKEALRLRMIATSENLANASKQINQNPELAALLAVEAYTMAKSNGGNENNAGLYSALSSALPKINSIYSPIIWSNSPEALALNISANQLNLISKNGNLNQFNLTSNSLEKREEIWSKPQEINTAYLDPNSSKYLLGLNSFEIAKSDFENPEMEKLAGHSGLLRATAFFEDGRIVTGGRDKQLIIWKNGLKEKSILLPARIKALVVLKEKNTALVGCDNGITYQVDLTSNELKEFASKDKNRVDVLTKSKNGKQIAIGYSSGIVQLFTAEGSLRKEIRSLGSISFIEIDEVANILAIATSAKIISLYKLSNLTDLPIELKLERTIKGFDFSKTENALYVYCTDRTVRKYPVKASWFARNLKKFIKRKLTKQEWDTFIGEDIPYLQSS